LTKSKTNYNNYKIIHSYYKFLWQITIKQVQTLTKYIYYNNKIHN